jgi:hydroxylaminobenzene mutase
MVSAAGDRTSRRRASPAEAFLIPGSTMEIRKPEPTLVRAGFILFTLALLTGFAVPAFLNQKMAVAAHLSGVMNGLVLIAAGLSWGLFNMSPRQASLTRGALLFAAFANWGTGCLAAAWGTNRLTPLSGAGFGAAPWKETVVQGLQVALAMAMLAAAISVVYALRSKPAGA